MNTLSEDQIWKLIEDMEWAKNSSKNSTKLQIENYFRYTTEHIEAIKSFIWAKHDLIYQKITTFEKIQNIEFECSEDTLFDIVTHTIGLGKEKFEDLFNNPEKIIEIIQNRDFKEGFINTIPIVNDPENSFYETKNLLIATEHHKRIQTAFETLESQADKSKPAYIELATLLNRFTNKEKPIFSETEARKTTKLCSEIKCGYNVANCIIDYQEAQDYIENWEPVPNKPLPTTNTYTFEIEISGCTYEQAQKVIQERIAHDQTYEYNYTIKLKK